MTIVDQLRNVRYVIDAHGARQEVIVPVETWERLLLAWEHLIDRLEASEDEAELRRWLQTDPANRPATISLDQLEQELADATDLPS